MIFIWIDQVELLKGNSSCSLTEEVVYVMVVEDVSYDCMIETKL